MEERLPIWRGDPNILSKQSRTADKFRRLQNEFYIHGSVHRNSRLKKSSEMQQYVVAVAAAAVAVAASMQILIMTSLLLSSLFLFR